jgi:hypothetical protein
VLRGRRGSRLSKSRADSTPAPFMMDPAAFGCAAASSKARSMTLSTDRFHALERDGSLRRAPGHISWNVWLDGRRGGRWRSFRERAWSSPRRRKRIGTAATHPGRIRLQTFRPGHSEPLTDALIGQGMMSSRRRRLRWRRAPFANRCAPALGRRTPADTDGGASRSHRGGRRCFG